MPTKKTRNVLVFAAMSGPQPWPCCFCGESVVFELEPPGRGGHAKSPTLHHIDGDHDNDDPTNWAWAHTGCHTSFHGVGRTLPPRTRALVSSTLTGRKLSAEHKENIRKSSVGRVLSPETKEAISVAQRQRWAQQKAQRGTQLEKRRV